MVAMAHSLAAACRSFPRGTRVIIFCSTKRMCDQLAWNLNREFGASAIHGDKKQQERDFVLAAFKVCTPSYLLWSLSASQSPALEPCAFFCPLSCCSVIKVRLGTLLDSTLRHLVSVY